ncbi:MAG: DNA polymerase III subunit gamma/tau [Candidatus Harrisonbacteria bacterium]|nr:DNA polymerase III subunit gamma/tau [Candidatus Harrisonbacteria bacterium]
MLAYYRKHRPKSFKDIKGQDHIVSVLLSAASQNRIAHAYLFHGPRGTGKTSMARLLAKVACCLTREKDKKFREKGEPCNQCQACLEIDAGRGIDVVEIDAATNTGVDEIRNLKEGIRLSPTSYPKKVIILDEVHMLSKSAFNALLKTLEEPPEHAVLILATTEYQKVPATIVSRTQRYHFRKLGLKEIVAKLKGIVKEEKLTAQDDALEFIAALSEGSFRDAESLLEQLAHSSDKLSLDQAEKILGRVGFQRVSEFAQHILQRDIKKTLSYIQELDEHGYNLTDLTKELIHYLRRVLTLKYNPELKERFADEVTQQELEKIQAHSKLIEAKEHIPLLKDLIAAYSQMRYSPFVAVPLEAALISHLAD